MIQVVSSDHFVFDSLVVILNAMVGIVAFENEQILNRELLILVPSNFKTLLLSSFLDFRCIQQIKNLFVVNLKERT